MCGPGLAPSYRPIEVREWLKTHRGPRYQQTRPKGRIQPFAPLPASAYLSRAVVDAVYTLQVAGIPLLQARAIVDADRQEIEGVVRAKASAPKSQVAARCECGAAKTGVADFAMGHSSWCPVK